MGGKWISDDNGEFELLIKIKTRGPNQQIYEDDVLSSIDNESLSCFSDIRERDVDILKGRER